MGKTERKTVAWRQKFIELAGVVVGPEAMNMEPDYVIEAAKAKGDQAYGLLDTLTQRIEDLVERARV